MSEFDSGRNNRTMRRGCKNSCSCSKDDSRTIQLDQLEPSLTDLILHPKSKKIARPPNAFMLFAREHRKSLAMKYPKHNNKNISSLLGECWRNVDETTKKEYYKKSKMLEELHKQKYPGYIYSPRIARMQKMAKKKKIAEKHSDCNALIEDDVPLEPIGQGNLCHHGSENCGEQNEINSEKKQPSPGYIPNNPHYFPDLEHGPQPELPRTVESNTPSVAPPAYHSCPPPPWDMPPAEPIAVPCSGRWKDECVARSDMYADNYYPESARPEVYDYGPWHRYPDYPYEPPVKSTWNSCGAGCQGECSAIHSNDDHSSYSHLPSPHYLELKNSYYHYNSPATYRNPPYSHTYRSYRDSPMPFRSRHYMPYPMVPPSKPPSSYFSHSMDYYRNQYQHHFKDYYPKHPYTAPTRDFSPIPEAVSSSECPTEVYDGRTVLIEESNETNVDSQVIDSQYQDVEQINAESDDNEILNVVDDEGEEMIVFKEEVVETTNMEHGQTVQDV